MKKIMILAAAAASLSLCSCDDFLTEDIRGRENLETYYSTQEEVDAAIGGCYFQIDKYGWWQVQQVFLLEEMMTDNAWDGNTSQEDGYREISHFYPTASSSGILANYWGARYQGITNCNTAIERVPGANMDEGLKAIRLAEARFLRAYFYFDLVKNFGGVPLIKQTLSNADGITRASLDECYEFIESELAAVAEILPQKSEWAPEDMGRATRGAALGLLGKAYLYQGNFPEAKRVLGTLISENEYDLMENFGDVWSVKHNNNKESLFEIQTMYGGKTYAIGNSIPVVSGCRNGIGDGWAWGLPSSDLENAYIAAGDSERLKWTIIKTACTSIAGEAHFSRFIDNNASCGSFGTVEWVNGVKTFNGNAAFKEYCKPVSEGGFGWSERTTPFNSYLIDPKIHKSARICRKYFIPLDDRPEIYNIDKIPLNHRILRYGDVLLMYAEACNETNDDGNARIALNRVRTRAKLAGVPESMSGDELRQAIRTERRLELAFEQNRLYDIRRWKDANGKTVMENLFGPNGSFVKYNTGDDADMYEKANQGESSDKGIRFQAPRDLLWPIPVYEIEHTNGSLTQNPGW